MDPTFVHLRTATRKGLLRRKPMWEQHAAVSAAELRQIGQRVGAQVPDDLVAFLEEFGFGNINDELSLRREWLAQVDLGPLKGHLVFAQDDRGNLYTTESTTGAIHYLDRFEPGYCRLASNFREFLQEALAREFEILAWAEAQTLAPYTSAV